MSSASTSATSTNSVHTERSTYDRRIAAAEPILRPQRPFTRLRSDGATSSADCSTNTKPRREDRVCAPHALGFALAAALSGAWKLPRQILRSGITAPLRHRRRPGGRTIFTAQGWRGSARAILRVLRQGEGQGLACPPKRGAGMLTA